MNYSNIFEDISQYARDASYDLAEDRHFAIDEDPHQPWAARARRNLEPELNGFTGSDLN